MNLQGKIKQIFETKEYGTNNFKKREFVVTTEEQYPQDIIMEMVQDKVTVLDSYSIGDQVDVSINLRGREWVNPQGETKYFNTILAWRIEKLSNAGSNQTFETVDAPDSNNVDDDLPF